VGAAAAARGGGGDGSTRAAATSGEFGGGAASSRQAPWPASPVLVLCGVWTESKLGIGRHAQFR
jgi:hypothetical protein